MAITGAKRLTVVQQASRNEKFRGRPLAVKVSGREGFETRAVEVIKNLPELLAAKDKDVEVKFYTPLGFELNAASLVGKTARQIDAMAAKVDRLSQAAIVRIYEIELEMIDLSERVSIMKGEVTVGLFKQVMEGDKINEKHQRILSDSLIDPEEALTKVNLYDAREFATKLSRLTGRKFRVQTQKEWAYGKKNGLSGSNFTWMDDTEGGKFVVRHLNGNTYHNDPGYRSIEYAMRLVEDK